MTNWDAGLPDQEPARPKPKKPPGGGFVDKYGVFQRVVEVEVDVEVEVLVEVLLDDPATMTPTIADVPTPAATVVPTDPVAAEVAARAEPAATPVSPANAGETAGNTRTSKDDLTRAFTGTLHFPERGYTHGWRPAGHNEVPMPDGAGKRNVLYFYQLKYRTATKIMRCNK